MKKIIYIIIITLIIVGLIYTKIKENKYEEIKIEETNINNIEEKENELIKIHIAGAVILPGVIELNEGSRITDAIEMAGGLAEEANIRKINLAKKIEDGEKIYIPYIGEDISDIIDEEIDISNYKYSNSNRIRTPYGNRPINSIKNNTIQKSKWQIQKYRRNKKYRWNRRSKI